MKTRLTFLSYIRPVFYLETKSPKLGWYLWCPESKIVPTCLRRNQPVVTLTF